jgi:two-component system alkaline phosphatase synthesis response regulator PhoP
VVRPKVLVVDDESDMVELVSFNLKSEGYDVISASNGLEALNQAREALPDLILLDLMLPELDGLAVCEILHRIPSTARIPIIMLTAWSSELSRIIGLETGADDYITKPFSPRELMLRVNRTLRAQAEKDSTIGNGSVE